MKKLNNFGFTLAEVLITLGIIGVVAALTIPTIIARYKAKVMEVQFKKAYSTLFNATEMLREQGLSLYELQSEELIELYAKVLKSPSKCPYNGQYYSGICNLKLTSLTGKGAYTNIARPAMQLDDGTLIGIGYKRGGIFLWINVDINGPQKGPNKVGYDLQVFALRPNDKFEPLTTKSQDTRTCTFSNPNSTDAYLGYGCTEYALLNKNPDGNGDYWYNFLNTK